MEVSPFLRLSLGSADATLEFQHASAGAPREAPPPQCDGGLSSFRYDPYLYYLDQWDFSESHYFDALSRMLDPASIRSNAHAVRRAGCSSKGTRAPDERTSQLRRALAYFPTSRSFRVLQAEFRFCLSLTAPPPLHRT